MRRQVRRIAISGLVALAAVLGVVAVPATAMAQPASAVRSGSVIATGTAGPALLLGDSVVGPGAPMISCVLTTDCLGIKGSSSQGDGGASTPTRVVRWNGSSWKSVGLRLPKGTKSHDLLGVSCRGVKSCLVVGDYYTSTSDTATSHALALSYNGTSLKPTPTVPLPKGMPYVALTGVSCATTRYCVAVGTASSPPFGITENDSATIIETWSSGAKWTLHTITTPASEVVEIDGVSCATSAFCVVTGTSENLNSPSFDSTLYFASWNGKKLTTMKPTAVGGFSDLVEPIGVSCATSSSCVVTAVSLGSVSSVSSGNTTTSTGFTEIWNGKKWQLATVTWPTGIAAAILVGVSCYAARSCEAVGVDGADVKKSVQAAAVSYNGTEGAVQNVPAPPKGDSSVFDYVSCLPWASCVAVGETGKSTATSDTVMTGVWNGKVWKLRPGF
jgi:hypothetical protein